MLLVFYNNGARESEIQEQIFVMPNCSELEEGVFIASAQNPTVATCHLSFLSREPADRTPRRTSRHGVRWTGPGTGRSLLSSG